MIRRSRFVEGVRYARFEISFRLADGRRRRWSRWSPVGGWCLPDELSREFIARGIEPEHVKPRSLRIALDVESLG